MQQYEEITEELFQQARIKPDQRFANECATASPAARKVITYMRQNAYRPLSVSEIRQATGFNGSLKAVLEGAKSVGAYLGSARIETASTMNAALPALTSYRPNLGQHRPPNSTTTLHQPFGRIAMPAAI